MYDPHCAVFGLQDDQATAERALVAGNSAAGEKLVLMTVGMGHVVDQDHLNLAIAEVAFPSARAAHAFFATDAFKRLLADQARHIDALGAYRVAAFHTFVRDGKPTTAGIRGSRQAELIDAVGAINHLTPDVRQP